MGKRKRIWHRLAAMLLAGMMCMTMLPVSAFADGAESVPTALETAAVDSSAPPTESESASSGDSAPLAESDPAAESSAGVSPATPESGSVQEPEEPPLSEAAQNFVAAVEALDRENILAAINDWAQASQAWQAEKENPELFTDANVAVLREMLEEGVRQEIAWGHYVIGDDIPGLTRDMVTNYIKYLGNLRWTGLGYGTLYEGFETEPENMAWVGQYSNANLVKTDFFEAKSTAYAKATALVDDL